ncbi:MAG: peroxiredoxin family protein [Acidimicrobiia bacterium]
MTTTPPTAPPFRAPSSRGQTLDLDSFAGKLPIVLFRSGPLSAGSLALVTELDRREVEFGHQRVQLLGVTEATAADLREFVAEHSIDAALIADPDGAIARDYGLDDDQHRAVVIDRALGVTALVGGPEPASEFAEWLLRAAELGFTDDPAPTDPNDANDVTPLGPQLDHGS